MLTLFIKFLGLSTISSSSSSSSPTLTFILFEDSISSIELDLMVEYWKSEFLLKWRFFSIEGFSSIYGFDSSDSIIYTSEIIFLRGYFSTIKFISCFKDWVIFLPPLNSEFCFRCWTEFFFISRSLCTGELFWLYLCSSVVVLWKVMVSSGYFDWILGAAQKGL